MPTGHQKPLCVGLSAVARQWCEEGNEAGAILRAPEISTDCEHFSRKHSFHEAEAFAPEKNQSYTNMTITVVISKDRTDRDPVPKYRFALWDERGDTYAQSRASKQVSQAKRDVERLFGPLNWRKPGELDIEAEWVLQAAEVECRAV